MTAIADADRVDLVISDVLMPGLDGTFLAGLLGREHPQLPILFVSGYGAPADLPAGVHFLAKPFTNAGLLRCVDDILGLAGSSRTNS